MNGENHSPGSKTDRMRRAVVGPTSDAARAAAPGGAPRGRRDNGFQAGLARYQAGDLAEAITLWERLLEEFPDDTETQRRLEEARTQQHLQELALEGSSGGLLDQIFKKGVDGGPPPAAAGQDPGQEDPESVGALFHKGEGLYHQGSYREARELFERVLEKQPAHPDAYFLLELSKAREADQREMQDFEAAAQRLYDEGDFEGAAREWKRIMESQPSHPKARQMFEAAQEAASGGKVYVPPKLGAAASDKGKAATPRPKVVAPTGPASRPPDGAPASGKPRSPSQESTQRMRAPVIAAGQIKSSARSRGTESEDATDERTPAAPTAPVYMPSAPAAPAAAPPMDEATSKKTLRELFDVASKAERDGELDRALDMYRRIQEIAPQNEVAQERISSLEMMLQSRKFKLAFDALSKAKALAQREPSRALIEVRRALQLRPEFEEAQKMQADLQKAVSQHSILRSSPMLLPSLGGIALFLIVVAWVVFGVIMPQIQEHKVASLLREGRRAQQQGRLSDAEDKILEARSLSPKSVDARRAYGQLLKEKGDAKGVVEVFRGLVLNGVGSAQDRFYLAWGLAHSGKDGEAQGLFQELIAEDQSFHEARREYAFLMIRQGKLAEASDQSTALLAAQPEEPENAVLAAQIFEKVGDEKQALENLDKAFKLGMRKPDQVRHHLELLIKNNRLDDAQSLLAEAKSAFPDEVEYRLLQASLARRRGKLDEAEDEFRKALYNSDTNEEAAYNLADVLVAKRDLRAAQKVLTSFIGRTDPSARIMALLGDTQMGLEAPSQAAESYRKAQQLDPNLPDISKKLDRAIKASKR
jgi:tetratricopeptide (TPR) repeat protein